MMSISFPSGPNALRLEGGRGRWCIEEVDLRVEAAAVGKLLHPGLVGADAGRTNPSTHDTAASKVGKQRRAQGAMVPSHHLCTTRVLACAPRCRRQKSSGGYVGIGHSTHDNARPPSTEILYSDRIFPVIVHHQRRRRGSHTTTHHPKKLL